VTRRRNSDAEIRRLERAAQLGDPEAAARLHAAQDRLGRPFSLLSLHGLTRAFSLGRWPVQPLHAALLMAQAGEAVVLREGADPRRVRNLGWLLRHARDVSRMAYFRGGAGSLGDLLVAYVDAYDTAPANPFQALFLTTYADEQVFRRFASRPSFIGKPIEFRDPNGLLTELDVVHRDGGRWWPGDVANRTPPPQQNPEPIEPLMGNPRGDAAVRRPGEGRDPKLEAWRRGLAVPPDEVVSQDRLWPPTSRAIWWIPGGQERVKRAGLGHPFETPTRTRWVMPSAYVSVVSWLVHETGPSMFMRAYEIHRGYGAVQRVNAFDYGGPRWHEPAVQVAVFEAYKEALDRLGRIDQ
jgi:hypothetical protein